MASPVDLAPLRAALDDVRAWSVECDEDALRTCDGDAADWIASWDHDSICASRDNAIQTLIDRGYSIEAVDDMVRVVPLVPVAPALRAALDELERLRADARRHADARAVLFESYLTTRIADDLYAVLRIFFAATEEP